MESDKSSASRRNTFLKLQDVRRRLCSVMDRITADDRKPEPVS